MDKYFIFFISIALTEFFLTCDNRIHCKDENPRLLIQKNILTNAIAKFLSLFFINVGKQVIPPKNAKDCLIFGEPT